jgi:asparagine synthase (glutamine-hydrolysing)
MCRIAGIVTREGRDVSCQLTSMLAQLSHGGPDDEGIYTEKSVSLGHRRLSIIDLSQAGHQPMISANSQLIISFNGEIYNFRELKLELQEVNMRFETATDTEVILKAYEAWGTKSFGRLRGMFSFSLYDKAEGKVFLVRDPVGIKPMYYFCNDQELIFASEVRAFLAYGSGWKQSNEWRTLFLAFGSIPHPYTTLDGVFQLPGGTYLDFDLKSFSADIIPYRDQANKIESAPNTVDTSIAATGLQLRKALKRHLISDAPLGVFLSGGIDSSLLTLLADEEANQEVQAVSVNFDESSFSEKLYQDKVMAGTKRTKQNTYTVTESLFWSHLDDIWKAMDQPSIDGINTYFVSLFARKAGLKAVLSGLGADEYFGGYASFKRLLAVRLLRVMPMKARIAKLAGRINERWERLIFLCMPAPIGDYLFLRGLFTPPHIAKLLNVSEGEVWKILRGIKCPLQRALNGKEYASFLESEIYMKNQLLKDTDYMSMWHGLEVRVPFLDQDLIGLAEQVRPSIRFRGERPKFLITKAFESILPEEIVFRKKKGFTFPFAEWIKKSQSKFQPLLPAGDESEKIAIDFQHNKIHWSKYWSLIVMKKFSSGAMPGV